WIQFVHAAGSLYQPDEENYAIFNALRREIIKTRESADHQGRRRLINALGLKKKPGYILDLINGAPTFRDAQALILAEYGVGLILRNRRVSKTEAKLHPGAPFHEYSRYCPLVEVRRPDTPSNAILCTEEEGFFILIPDKGAIFVSGGPPKGYRLELIVIRKVLCDDSYTQPLKNWLRDVVQESCSNRRNPNHPGKMVQIGMNMGPRHARVLGWAVSFTRKLSDKEKTRQDANLLGAMSLLWALAKSYVPLDITDPMQKLLDESYPTMATPHIPVGCGFSVTLDGTEYAFKETSRAPPEGVVTMGYEAHSHVDGCSTDFAISWTVIREILDSNELPENAGSNFIDLGLGVVVQGAGGTMTIFQPERMHGTSERGGIMAYGLAINFTRRVADAIQELIERGQTVRYGLDTDTHKHRK
ncbi:hypothetical protein K443DRAFT_117460, partial [Laccaria amethystina LaAM-08-1]